MVINLLHLSIFSEECYVHIILYSKQYIFDRFNVKLELAEVLAESSDIDNLVMAIKKEKGPASGNHCKKPKICLDVTKHVVPSFVKVQRPSGDEQVLT